MTDSDGVNLDPHPAVQPAPAGEGDPAGLAVAEAAAWVEAGVVDQSHARALHDSGVSPAEVRRYGLGPAIAAGRVPLGEAVTVLRALRAGQQGDGAGGGVAEPRARDGADQARARRDAVVFVRKLTGQLRPPALPATTPLPGPTTEQVQRIAGGAIRHYQRRLGHDDPAAAWTAAVRHAVSVHAALDGGVVADSHGDPKPAAEQVRAVAEAAVGLYGGYVHEHGLAPEQVWRRMLDDVLGAWAPPGLSPAAWWLHEQLQEEVGTRVQRAELAVVLAAYNHGEGWLGRVPAEQARAVDAAIQHDALRPTRRLRAQVAAAVGVLRQRPRPQAHRLRQAQEVVARLRSLQTVLERRPRTAGRHDPALDSEHGLAQVAVRLRAANRQVAELEGAQRLAGEWDEGHAFELARAEAAALALRARELALTARLEASRPPWLAAAVGPAPTEATRRARWREGVLVVLRWRADHHVTDQTRPLGAVPTDPAELRRYRQAVQRLSGIARSIGHTPVLADSRTQPRAASQLGRIDFPPPPLPGSPEAALGPDAGLEIGVDLP